MNNKIFAISDIHGCHDLLEELLKTWNPDNEQLLFLGDYVDRGKDSLKVLRRVKELHEQYGAVALGGNHEDLFLAFMESPWTEQHYVQHNGGREAIISLVPEEHRRSGIDDIVKYIEETHTDIISFMRELPNYHESEEYIFVHAGVNLHLKDWKQTRRNDFRWIRDPFIYGTNKTGKTIVFGHTPTVHLNEDRSYDVWFSPCGTKIGIDGGAVFGGELHGILIDGEHQSVRSVRKEKQSIL